MKGFDEMAAGHTAGFRHIDKRNFSVKVFEQKPFCLPLLPRREFAGLFFLLCADAAVLMCDMRLESERDMVDEELRRILGLRQRGQQ
ncbi:hypothetical protein BSLA_03f0574 [Burkholderia stabilis]|nr:hypothetical protein BSLA_03f0574 [Burkholderia stabilis]